MGQCRGKSLQKLDWTTNKSRVEEILGFFLGLVIWKLCHIYWKYVLNINIATNSIPSTIKDGFKVELTDGKSIGGYNLALCLDSFISALLLFILSCLSFVFDLGTCEGQKVENED